MSEGNSPANTVDWLIVIPTPLEREKLRSVWPNDDLKIAECRVRIALCGFGAIVPAAQVTRLIQLHQPGGVMLVGIAGAYSDDLKIGQAYRFSAVACYGLGIGNGDSFISAQQAGWQQWSGDKLSPAIGDHIDLRNEDFPSEPTNNNPINLGLTNPSPANSLDPHQVGCLLTVTSASADPNEARQKKSLFPDVVAEDMEGFSVAVGCQFAGVPLVIIRGISNQAGDREKSNWRVSKALKNAAVLAKKIIEQYSNHSK